MPKGLLQFIKNNLSTGDRLTEIFYGVFMVSVVTGMINATRDPSDPFAEWAMLIAALGVNISWGIIDGLTNVIGGLIDRADEDRLINSLRADKNNSQLKDKLLEDLQDSAVGHLNDSERIRVADMILAESPEESKKYFPSKDDYKIALAVFLIDFITIFPVVLPFIIFQDADRAVFFSHTIAVILFFLIGYYWALHLNWNKLKTGIILAVIGATVIAVSFYFGW